MIIGGYQYIEAGVFYGGQIFVGSTESGITPVRFSSESYLRVADGNVCFTDFFFYQFKVVRVVVSLAGPGCIYLCLMLH